VKAGTVKALFLAATMGCSYHASAQDKVHKNVDAIQEATISMLKKKLDALEIANKELAARVAKVEVVAADGVTRGTNAQSTANDALNRANSAQTTANFANNRAANPVVMVGRESGRPWAQCPDGYHWIGGFNFGDPQVNVAFAEVNRWHKSWAWFCAKD
jgi:hypothetical protein